MRLGKMLVGIIGVGILLILFLPACQSREAKIATTSTVFPVESETPVATRFSPPTLTATFTNSPKLTLTASPTWSPTASSTPNFAKEGPLLTFTSWENNTSFVYGMPVGCFETERPCFGEMKLLFQIQNVHIWNAQWSPNGKKLALQGQNEIDSDKFEDIYIVDNDGKNLINLTNIRDIVSHNEFRTIAQFPQWSPDGQTLAYNVCNLGCKVFATNITTNETSQMLEKLSPSEDYRYTDIRLGGWSPTGEKMVFTINDFEGVSQIYSSDLNGDNLMQITNTLENNYTAHFSSDGKWILVNREFSSEGISLYSSLFLVNSDGTEERRLTNNEVFYLETLSWYFDSSWFPVIQETGPETGQIFLINFEGESVLVNLEIGKYSNPEWKPMEKP